MDFEFLSLGKTILNLIYARNVEFRLECSSVFVSFAEYCTLVVIYCDLYGICSKDTDKNRNTLESIWENLSPKKMTNLSEKSKIINREESTYS